MQPNTKQILIKLANLFSMSLNFNFYIPCSYRLAKMAKYHYFENILQSTIVSKICRNLPLIGNSSLKNSSFPWYSSSWNLSFIKNNMANLKTIFSKNSSYTGNSSFTKSSFQKNGIFSQTVVYDHFSPYRLENLCHQLIMMFCLLTTPRVNINLLFYQLLIMRVTKHRLNLSFKTF